MWSLPQPLPVLLTRTEGKGACLLSGWERILPSQGGHFVFLGLLNLIGTKPLFCVCERGERRMWVTESSELVLMVVIIIKVTTKYVLYMD